MRYDQILTRLHAAPLAIEGTKLDIITREITLKAITGENLTSGTKRDKVAIEATKIPVVQVYDSLVAKNGIGDSGVTSYESLKSQTAKLVAEGHKKLIIDFDTPGGEVARLFGTSAYWASLAKQGIELIGVVDGMAASAGYVLASPMSRIYATSSSILGSLGVLMTLINVSEAEKDKGIEYTILRSRAEKALLNPHEAFPKAAITEAMKTLKELDTIMMESITGYRPTLDLKIIDELNGKTVLAQEALELNLIDGIVTSLEEVIDMETSKSVSSTKVYFTTKQGANMTLEEQVAAATAEVAKLKGDMAVLNASVAETVKDAVKAETERGLGIIKGAITLGLPIEMAVKRITANTSVEDAIGMFEDVKEMTQLATGIDTTVAQSTLNAQTIAASATDEKTFISKLVQAATQSSPQAQA